VDRELSLSELGGGRQLGEIWLRAEVPATEGNGKGKGKGERFMPRTGSRTKSVWGHGG
jgi:hypothetical protein